MSQCMPIEAPAACDRVARAPPSHRLTCTHHSTPLLCGSKAAWRVWCLKIKSASYGTQMGSRFSRRIDVKSLLQTRIDQSGHNELRLNIDENLDDLFGCKLASWAGAELRILYEVPSFCLQMDVPVHKDASGLQRIGAELRIGYLRKPTTAPAPVDSGAKRREILGKKGGRTATGMMEDNGVAVDQPRPHRAHRWTGNYDIDQDRFHGKGVK